MKTFKIIGIILICLFLMVMGAAFMYVFIDGKPKTETVTITHNVIERQFPVFRMASFQINYSGKIYTNGTDRIFFNIPTGGYTVRFDYEAEILIGAKSYPIINVNNDILTIDFSEVILEVLAVTPTSLELVNANTSGWRWFIGGGIPIQTGLFEPVIETINNAPDILNYDENIQTKALDNLIELYKNFYSIFNYNIEIVNLK